MRYGISIATFAAGLLLVLLTDASVLGIETTTIGLILVAGGAVGMILSVIRWTSWGPVDSRPNTNGTENVVGRR